MRKEYLYGYIGTIQDVWDNHTGGLTEASLCDGSIESAAKLWPWTPMFRFNDFDSDEPNQKFSRYCVRCARISMVSVCHSSCTAAAEASLNYRWLSYGREFRTSWHYDMMEFDGTMMITISIQT